jgi:N-carbamoylputrescine amidase
VIAANRVGTETGERCSLTFYGSSFITDGCGAIIEQAPRAGAAVVTADLDLDELAAARAAWGLFRDRRPDLYVPVLSLDGQDPSM